MVLKSPCPIRVRGDESSQISWVPTEEIQMLGVPLGCDEKGTLLTSKANCSIVSTQ